MLHYHVSFQRYHEQKDKEAKPGGLKSDTVSEVREDPKSKVLSLSLSGKG
jgi:hypothetical protein